MTLHVVNVYYTVLLSIRVVKLVSSLHTLNEGIRIKFLLFIPYLLCNCITVIIIIIIINVMCKLLVNSKCALFIPFMVSLSLCTLFLCRLF